MASFTVTNLFDSGKGSLRQAIQDANQRSGADTINFANSLSNKTINLSTGDLTITDSLTINGLGSQLLKIDGNNQGFRVFKINPGKTSSINVSINGLTITGGNPSGEGGGIYSNFANLTLTDSIITGNTVNGSQSDDFDGGGVYSKKGSVTVRNSIITGNTCLGDTPDGGGIYSIDGSLTVINSTITGNKVNGLRFDGGGGIYGARGSITIVNSTISNNSTFADSQYESADGGGIFIREGNLSVTNSTISGNVASGAKTDGGGIYSRDSRLSVTNSTISNNLASVRGGGIFVTRGRVKIANSTISGNGAVNGGGIFNRATLYLSNTIIANSLAGGDCINYKGSLVTNSNNLIEDGSCRPALSGDPKLGPLQDNGGPTFTQALLFDSPAINAGNNALIPADVSDLDGDGNTTEPLPVDQRGQGSLRIKGGTVDLGAFEAQSDLPKLSVNDLTVIDDPEGLSNAIFTVTLSNPSSTTVTVRYRSLDGSASSGLDYIPVSGSLTINPGQDTATITVPITADTLVEAPETFDLILENATDAEIVDATGYGTITNLDPTQYEASYNDLIQIGDNLDALREHYYTIGRFEGRKSDLFDEFRYIASNPDLIPIFGTDGAEATEHYLHYGFFEQRSMTAFDPARYLDSYDDLLGVYGTNTEAATQHYLMKGWSEERDPNLFKSDRYIASYGDLIEAFQYNLESGSNHYLNLGRLEGRQITFDPVAYLNRNPDVFAVYGNDPIAAARHYIDYGYSEQRLTV